TKETLHRYTQIVGKIQLGRTPIENHFWNVALRMTSRGLATSALEYEGRTFDIEIDLVEHAVHIRTSDGGRAKVELRPLAVADFYREIQEALDRLGIDVPIWDHPVELKTDVIPFSQDRMHAEYDREYANRFFHVLSSATEVLEEFRSRFTGKCSGVGFYWGTFDVSVAMYSGRAVENAPTESRIEREAYSHELIEVGFWPGDAVYQQPAFFAMQWPMPESYAHAHLEPADASWLEPSRCFVLPYESGRNGDYTARVLDFCQSAYETGANMAGWDPGLERNHEMWADH
ncbi:MAG TPA: DUF5996 family protein, partial [Kofleriaceae bacterium]|nr:DUF5996 family protein [Kofleriaceae bacterium]